MLTSVKTFVLHYCQTWHAANPIGPFETHVMSVADCRRLGLSSPMSSYMAIYDQCLSSDCEINGISECFPSPNYTRIRD